MGEGGLNLALDSTVIIDDDDDDYDRTQGFCPMVSSAVWGKAPAARLEPAPQGMGAPQADQRWQKPLGTTKPNFDFSFCESTFDVVSTQSAPDLPHPQVEHALTGIFLFSNEPMACQILNLKRLCVCVCGTAA